MNNQDKKYELPTEPKKNYNLALVIIAAILIMTSLIIILIIVDDKTEKTPDISSYNSGDFGEVPAVSDMVEDLNSTEELISSESVFDYVNRYQGNNFPYTSSCCKIAANEDAIFYASDDSVIKIDKKTLNEEVICNGIFNNLTIVGDKIICTGVISRGMIGDTTTLCEIDLNTNKAKAFSIVDTKKIGTHNSVLSFVIDGEYIYYTLQNAADDNIYCLNRTTNKFSTAIEITPDFTNDSYVIKSSEEGVLYFFAGEIKCYNPENATTQTLLSSSKNISINNNPIELDGSWITYDNTGCYINNECIYSATIEVFTINTNGNYLYIADGTKVLEYDILKQNINVIYEANTDIKYLYVTNNELYTMIDGVPEYIK